VPRQDLYVSHSLDDGSRIADQIVSQGYHAVLWGGGDGTFANGVAEVSTVAARLGRRLPEMGSLRLGTGNAIGDTIGSGPATPQGAADDLRRARAPRPFGARQLPMLDVEGRPGLFCGFGLDAQILDDYGATVRTLKRARLADHMKSAGLRYFLAVSGRSIPRFVAASRPEVVAINRGAPAVRVDVDGRPMGAPIPAGRVLWRGVATLASAGTIPFYGLGLRIFPHADRVPGRFQLRLSDLGAPAILAHLPRIWKGTYRSERIADFMVDEVELVLSRPAPFQANGDLLGDRERATLKLWHRSIPVV
jgi:diacylglycerol kinase family enzyme